jgi:hypothetical protein
MKWYEDQYELDMNQSVLAPAGSTTNERLISAMLTGFLQINPQNRE